MKTRRPSLKKGLALLEKCATFHAAHRLDDALAVAIESVSILEQYNRPRELAEALRRIGVLYGLECNYSESLVHLQRSVAVLHAAGETAEEALVRRLCAVTHAHLAQDINALREARESLRLFRQLQDRRGTGSTLMTLGGLLTRRGDYASALVHCLESVELLSQEPIDGKFVRLYLTEALVNTAGVFVMSDDPRSALEYHRKALEVADTFKHGHIYNDMGTAYVRLEDEASALKYYRMAYAALKKVAEPRLMTMAVVAGNIGRRYFKAGRYELGIRYTKQACAHYEASGDPARLAEALAALAEIYTGSGRAPEALPLLERALALATTVDIPWPLEQVHQALSRCHEAIANFELALKHSREAEAIHRTRISAEMREKTETLKLRFEQDRLLREEEMRQRNDVMNAVIEAQEAERQRIARDLHDGVGQMLAAAGINVARAHEMSRRNGGPEGGEIDSSLERSLAILVQASTDVRTISHALGTSTLRELGLPAALRELLASFGPEHSTRFDCEAVGMEKRLPEHMETALFRIAQELIANVLRHADAAEATVQIVRDGSEIRLAVEDNGVGFDTGSTTGGMGRRNIDGRASAIGGSVMYDSTPGHGTTVVVSVKEA